MPKPKHTPAPWVVVISEGSYYLKNLETGCIVCEIRMRYNNYAEADLNLISAAPEMLAALLEYKRLYEEVQPAGGWQGVYEGGNTAINKGTSASTHVYNMRGDKRPKPNLDR